MGRVGWKLSCQFDYRSNLIKLVGKGKVKPKIRLRYGLILFCDSRNYFNFEK